MPPITECTLNQVGVVIVIVCCLAARWGGPSAEGAVAVALRLSAGAGRVGLPVLRFRVYGLGFRV